MKERWLFKMNLKIIVAISENNVIGINNKIPWRIPEDMKRFKELTTGHPVIMGSKTYLSIPEKFRPLPDRKNIILSKKLEPQNGIYIAKNIEEALSFTENEDSFVIGGSQIYEEFLPRANFLEITKVHETFDGDSFFPEINWNDWKKIYEKRQKSEKGLEFSFQTFKRNL